ncbi:MAG: response regulator [Candidatus Gottesmanbacteria bacterium GW2011_GWA2_43_14]|uniref:Response regulator n=1 Tax=Candidatus Gottesmanbacteria bacterium GW2011_GWA2_43_14 TaxID=1618443 RepID=A0A0G1DKR1_9BACT|nr:MAG: response regulator [Candidatus Gottesmanbacteria bacterium GW2011_GWA2_43_14]
MNGKKHILIVDDDSAILDVIQIILNDAGYATHIISDGDQVRNFLNRQRVDLILLDIWMSGMDGSEITKMLKDDNGTKSIPVIMISANNQGMNIAKSSGADGFIAKPFEIDQLLNVVAKFINGKKLLTENY